MKKQDYSNHIQYYPPHHFVFYPVLLTVIITSFVFLFRTPDHQLEWGLAGLSFIFITWLSYMLRQHYALTLQNRIVRLELRFRYFSLTQRRFEELEDRLSFPQIAALRFASDAELPALVDRTVGEQLSPQQIKQSIREWLPDHMRV